MKNICVNVTTKVNSADIRQETRDGRQVIIVPSCTLPRNIVMNGIMYPEDEIKSSYMTLEKTPAPFGHPEIDGEFVSAIDPEAINQFYFGAFNENVRYQNNKVYLDKVIDVEVAERTEYGREVLAAIEKRDPIHTSTGVFLQVEDIDEEQVNEYRQNYQQIARNMQFDHDCVLLKEPGAATPEQGVGMMVNKEGQKLHVNNVTIPPVPPTPPESRNLPTLQLNEAEKGLFKKIANFLGFADDSNAAYNGDSKYLLNTEDEQMKNRMVEALKKANRYKEDMDDDAIMNAYGDMMKESGKPKKDGDDKDNMKKNSADSPQITALTDAIAALTTKVDTLATNADQAANARRAETVSMLVNSGEYTEEELKDAPEALLNKMAANAGGQTAQFFTSGYAVNKADDQYSYTNMEAPE